MLIPLGRLIAGGSISTQGDGVPAPDVDGLLDAIEVRGAITASGRGSDAVRVGGDVAGLDKVSVKAEHGQAVVRVS